MAAKRIPRKRILVAGLVLLGILLGGVLFLSSPPFERYLLNKADGLLRERFRLSLEADSLQVHPFRLAVTVHCLELHAIPSATAPADLVLSAEDLELDLSLSALLRRRPHIQRLAVSRPRLNLPQSWIESLRAMQEKTAPAPAPASLDFRIDDLRLEDGTASTAGETRDLRASLSGISLEVRYRREAKLHVGNVRITGGDIAIGPHLLGLRGIEFQGELRSDRLTIEGFAIDSDLARIEVSGEIRDLPTIPNLKLKLRSGLDLGGIAAFFPEAPPGQGELLVEGTLTGEPSDPEFKGSLEGGDLSLADIPISRLQSALTAKRSSITISEFQLEGPDGTLKGEGAFAFDTDRESSLRLEWREVRPEALAARVLPGDLIPASIWEGSLEAAGSPAKPETLRGRGSLRMNPDPQGNAAGLPLGGRIGFAFEEGRLRIQPGELAAPGARLRFSALLDLSGGITAQGLLESPDLAALRASLLRYAPLAAAGGYSRPHVPDLQGGLSASFEVQGNRSSPRGLLRLSGRGIQAAGVPLDSLELEARGEAAGLLISRFLLESRAGRIEGSGWLPLESPRESDPPQPLFSASLSRMDITAAAAFLPDPVSVSGKISGTLAITGSVSSPEAEFVLDVDRPRWQNWILDSAEIRGVVRTGMLEIEHLAGRRGGGRVWGRLNLDLEGRTYTARLEGQGVKPGELLAAGEDAGFRPAGTLGFALEGRGGLSRPVFDLDMDWASPGLGRFSASRLVLNARADGTALRIKVSIPEGQTELTAQTTLPHPEVVSGRFRTRGLDLLSMAGRADAGLESSSEISFTSEFTVPLNHPLDAVISVRGDRLMLRHRHLMLSNTQPFRVGLKDGAFTCEGLRLSGDDLAVSLQGILPWEGSSPQPLTAEIRLDLMILEPFLPAGDASGVLEIRSQVGGSVSSPRPSGHLSLRSGSWTTPELPVGIRDAALDLEWDDASVRLRDMELGIGQGSLQARGEIPISGLLARFSSESLANSASEGSLRITLEHLHPRDFLSEAPPDVRDDIEGNLDADFDLSGDFGSLSGLVMTGNISDLWLGFAGVRLEADRPARLAFRDGRLQIFDLNLMGKNSLLQVSGHINLSAEPECELQITSSLDLGEFTPLVERSTVGGLGSLDLKVEGPLKAPRIQGWIQVERGLVRAPDIGLLLSDLESRVTITSGRIQIPDVRGSLNGGAITARGEFSYLGLSEIAGRLELEAQPVQVTYPEGFQAEVEGTMALTAQQGQWLLTGDLQSRRMYYAQDHYPGRELWSAIRYRTPPSVSDIPPLIRSLNLEVDIALLDPLVIDNNLADIELTGNLRVAGTPVVPLFSGYLANREVGEVEVGGRTYQVETFNMNFPGKEIQEAVLDLSAHTYLTYNHEEVEITLSLSGPLTRLTYSLRSSPPMSQTELASLLITGQGADRLKNEAANIIGNQMILYFTSPLASPLTNRIRDFLKAESVSLEPINITSEADPGARFTLRKALVQNLDLVYSVDIGNTQLQTWILDFSLKRNFGIQAFQQDDGTYGGSLSHRFRPRDLLSRNKAPSVAKASRPTIRAVEYEGDLAFGSAVLARAARSLRPGKPFDYRLLRRASDRLTAFYKGNGYLNAFVDPKVSRDTGGVLIRFAIIAGEPAGLEFSGSELPAALKREIKDSWNSRIPEDVRLGEAERGLKRALQSKGYFLVSIDIQKLNRASARVYRFIINAGPRFRPGLLTLSPNTSLTSRDIKKSLAAIPFREGHPYWSLLTDFRRSRRRILDLLVERGYQSARVKRPLFSPDSGKKIVDIHLEIEPGPQTQVRSVQVDGQKAIPEPILVQSLQAGSAKVFSPFVLAEDSNRVLNLYRERGYQDAVVSVEVNRESPSLVDIRFAIQEGQQHIIKAIEISGNRKTPDSFIRRELTIHEGEPVNLEELILSQKKLYELGIFRSASILRDPLYRGTPEEVIHVEVEEEAALTFRYGVRYHSEEKVEGFGQIDLTNLWGRGRNGLIFYRQNEREKDFRFSLSDPYLFGVRFNTLHSFYYLEKTESVFRSEEISYTLQQEQKLPWNFSLSYLYRIGRNRSYIPDWTGPFSSEIIARVSELQTFLIRDTRADRLNAKQGHFLSLSLTFSPEFLGPDLPYIRLFGQYSLYTPLGSSILWASNLRIGLAEAFDQVLLVSRRFFAGGANSLRGFERDAVGPFDPDLQANAGGEALWILNQELRFPLYKWLGGVLFYDMGNVYLKRRDFNPFEARQGIGVGLRLDTPAGLIRLDYGVNLFPKNGEPRRVFYFSIGQVF